MSTVVCYVGYRSLQLEFSERGTVSGQFHISYSYWVKVVQYPVVMRFLVWTISQSNFYVVFAWT